MIAGKAPSLPWSVRPTITINEKSGIITIPAALIINPSSFFIFKPVVGVGLIALALV